MNNQDQYDVIIIGGSYTGLSAAMALGRSLRRVLIIDSGAPCNQPVREAQVGLQLMMQSLFLQYQLQSTKA